MIVHTTFKVKTEGHQRGTPPLPPIDVTPQVLQAIERAGCRDGLVNVFTPHATAAINGGHPRSPRSMPIPTSASISCARSRRW